VNTKRWVSLAAALVLFLGMVYVVGRYSGTGVRTDTGPWDEVFVQGEGDDVIAVVNVEGEIVETGGGDGVAVADDLVSQLQQARRDDTVKAVILRLNTPGGSVVASDEVYREVLDLRRAGKPVVASMGGVAASGGYFISAGADRIVANPSTITGSIGVILVLVNLQDAAGKLGIEPVVITAGRLKDIGSPFRELTEEEREIFQTLLDEAYDRFTGVVGEGRHLSSGEVTGVADGRPLSGAQAQEAGLVDELGDFDAAVEAARELADIDEATVVEYAPDVSLADLLRPQFPGFDSPVEEIERRVGVTGPVLKYLYVA
jgi:protease IV